MAEIAPVSPCGRGAALARFQEHGIYPTSRAPRRTRHVRCKLTPEEVCSA